MMLLLGWLFLFSLSKYLLESKYESESSHQDHLGSQLVTVPSIEEARDIKDIKDNKHKTRKTLDPEVSAMFIVGQPQVIYPQLVLHSVAVRWGGPRVLPDKTR